MACHSGLSERLLWWAVSGRWGDQDLDYQFDNFSSFSKTGFSIKEQRALSIGGCWVIEILEYVGIVVL